MTYNQKKTDELVLETWNSLKEKIGELVGHLVSQKTINEQIVTNYQTKLRKRDQLVSELEERQSQLREQLRKLSDQNNVLKETIGSKKNLIKNYEDKLEEKNELIEELEQEFTSFKQSSSDEVSNLKTQISILRRKSIDNYTRKLIFLPHAIKNSPNLSASGLMYTRIEIKEGDINSDESLVDRTDQVHSNTRTLLHIFGDYH